MSEARNEDMRSFIEIYQYREMLMNLVRKGLRTRYKGSVLGFLWTFINPLLQLCIYSVVFSIIVRANVDRYYIYLFVALVPWMFFASSIQESASSIVGNKDLVKKIYFPRIVIPLSVVFTAFMNMLFSMVIVFAAILISGIGLNGSVLFLPIIMIAELLFTIGISIIVAGLNVYFRDIEHIMGILMMMWFYLTPILYTVDMIPERLRIVFTLNPMSGFISCYRDILYYGQMPNLLTILPTLGVSLLVIVFGVFLFQRLQRGFVEEL